MNIIIFSLLVLGIASTSYANPQPVSVVRDTQLISSPTRLKQVLLKKTPISKDKLTQALLMYISPVSGKPDIELISLLLQNGADVNARATIYRIETMTNNGFKEGETQQFDVMFLQEPRDHANIQAARKTSNVGQVGPGDTPLLYAVKEDNPNLDLIKLLIDHKADVNAVDNQNFSVLFYALKSTPLVNLLLDNGAGMKKTGAYQGDAIIVAIKQKPSLDLITALVNHGANVNACDGYGRPVLFYAVTYPEIVKLLINKGADARVITCKGHMVPASLLIQAVKEHASMDVINLFIDQKIDLNIVEKEKTALHYALYDYDLTKFLLEHGIDPNKGQPIILTALTMNASTQLLDLLLSHHANIDAQNTTGGTALMYAADMNNKQSVQFLLARDANPNITDKDGINALGRAYKKGYTSIIRILEPVTKD